MNILNKLTIKHMKMNKKRTIVTIIGVILSSALLFGIGLCVSTMRTNMLNDIIKQEGEQHVILHDYPYSELSKLENRNDISIVGYTITDFEGKYGSSFYNVKVVAYPDYEDVHLWQGSYPKANEILISRDLIRMYANEKGYSIGDSLTIGDKTYIISGIYDRIGHTGYQYDPNRIPGESTLFTYFDLKEDTNLNVQLKFNSLTDIYDQIEKLGLELGYEPHYSGNLCTFEEMTVNYRLLSLYGHSTDDSQNAILFLYFLLLSTILGLVCIFVIYNSFAISVAERKKMFAMFASVGATPRQLLKSVFFEAFLIGLIAIPIGFLLSVGIVAGVISILNNILKDILIHSYQLSFYPTYLLGSFVFILVTLFLSALFPAKRASETTPLESIRMQKEIRNKKTNGKWIYNIFGIEGLLAYKNMRRNKRKYRVTTISLCVSIILFLTFSTYINYGLLGYGTYILQKEPDATIAIEEEAQTEKVISLFQNIPYITSSLTFEVNTVVYKTLDKKYYHPDYYNQFYVNQTGIHYMHIYVLDEHSYQTYLKKVGLKEERPILYNSGNMTRFEEEEKTYNVTVFDPSQKPEFTFCQMEYQGENHELKNCIEPISDIYFTNISPFQDYNGDSYPGSTLVVNEEVYKKIRKLTYQDELILKNIYINTDSILKLDHSINDIINKYPNMNINYHSAKLELYEQNQTVTAVRFALYSFIFFITMIALTSVMSTIYTSMQLRRKEFAVLRSIGLTPKGFQKMLCLESVFFGIRSLLYGLLISFGIIYLIQQIAGLSYGSQKIVIPFPTQYVIICIIGVFVIVFFAMIYSTRKMKNENIISAIEEENR